MLPYLALSVGFQILAFQLTEGMVTVLVVQLATVVLFILKDRSDRQARKEEREERVQLAKLTQSGLDEVKTEGGRREARIVREVKQTKQVAIAGVKSAKAAFKEANGVNQKIAALGQTLADDKSPQQVEVVNTADHPVPVESQPQPSNETD